MCKSLGITFYLLIYGKIKFKKQKGLYVKKINNLKRCNKKLPYRNMNSSLSDSYGSKVK